jgi:hypothetical protein
VQAVDPRPVDAPYTPAGQGEHDPEPATLYCPVGHKDAVALVLPATQAYPAVQLPVHDDDVSPPVAPYLPAGHWTHTMAPARLYCPAAHAPLHAEVVSREVDPNCPAGHSVQLDDPVLGAYCPCWHGVHGDPENANCPLPHHAQPDSREVPAEPAFPLGQSLHDVDARLSAYLPEGHCRK